ncbi:hypothetical protein C8T65DRAFT_657724 [Cerioporus squamosus]|nr:hypothetical protein C8T65DRAFT_657724 [Cerioporus squamosus]
MQDTDDYVKPQYVPAELRYCDRCGQPEAKGRKLRKCSACASVVYCGRECQRAAWSKHKLICRVMDGDKEVMHSMDAKVRRLGFQSGEAFSQALLDFIDAHTWAFERLTSAHVLHMGGIEALQDPPKLVEIVLRCRPSYKVERNPASAFHVVGQGIHPLSAHLCRHPKAQENWDMAAPTRENTHNIYLKMGDPTYVCLIPVMYVVENVSISEMFFYPQYRWTHPEPPPRALLSDVFTLCSSSINECFPLRVTEGTRSVLPGQFVRSKGRWVWQPLFSEWSHFAVDSSGHRGLQNTVAELGAGDRLPELISAISAL